MATYTNAIGTVNRDADDQNSWDYTRAVALIGNVAGVDSEGYFQFIPQVPIGSLIESASIQFIASLALDFNAELWASVLQRYSSNLVDTAANDPALGEKFAYDPPTSFVLNVADPSTKFDVTTLFQRFLDRSAYNTSDRFTAKFEHRNPGIGNGYLTVHTKDAANGKEPVINVVTSDEVANPLWYCTRADIEDRFGVENVKLWADLDSDKHSYKILKRIWRAIEDSYNEINDVLRGSVYAVPLTTTSGAIPSYAKRLCAILAGVWLYESRGVQDFSPETGESTHRLSFHKNVAERMLQELRKGRIDLDATRTVGYPKTYIDPLE